MAQTSISFNSKGVSLDGIVTMRSGIDGPLPGVIVCHPHPIFGGHMDNDVVTNICHVLYKQGIATFRFNFRSAHADISSVTDGRTEQDDLNAAIDLFRALPQIQSKCVGLAGYSFGAAVILGGLKMYKVAKAMALISPPVTSVEASNIGEDKRPRLFLIGEKDRLVNVDEIKKQGDAFRHPAIFQSIPEADHSWNGMESVVASSVTDFFVRYLR